MWGKRGLFAGITAENWVEYVTLILLVVGFFLALSTGSAVVSYAVIFFCGIVAARMSYTIRGELGFPLFIIIIGFLIGYVFGSHYGNRKVTILFFIIGYIIGYYIHSKGYIQAKKEKKKKGRKWEDILFGRS